MIAPLVCQSFYKRHICIFFYIRFGDSEFLYLLFGYVRAPLRPYKYFYLYRDNKRVFFDYWLGKLCLFILFFCIKKSIILIWYNVTYIVNIQNLYFYYGSGLIGLMILSILPQCPHKLIYLLLSCFRFRGGGAGTLTLKGTSNTYSIRPNLNYATTSVQIKGVWGWCG